MISKELEIKVRQHFFRDHWPVGTIATQLGIHPDTVKRVTEPTTQQQAPRARQARETPIETHRDYIKGIVEQYPNIRATRLLDMLRVRGYTASVYPVRRLMKELAPRGGKAFLDLKFTPGEQAQVDWGSFGTMAYGEKKRPIHAFVMVLSYSRRIYARFFHDMKSARVLEAHCLAFEYFSGAPLVVLYDNMKTAVIENLGVAVRFNNSLLDMASHFHFEPRACNPRSGWEKGRTERAIRYLREAFFTGREFSSLGDLNEQLASWLMDVSDKRGWPDDREKTVMKAFSEENLAPLPQAAYEPYEERRVRVDKKAFITFDTNRYPVDPEWVGFYLSLRACHGSIKLYHESKLLHTHERHWGRAVTIQSKDHQQKIAKSRGIKAHRGDRHALVGTLPSAQQLFEFWRDLGYSLSASAREVIGYINLYGVERVEAAAKIAIAKGAPSSCSIGYLLSQENDQPQPKIQFQLPRDIANIEVHHPPMSDYDELYNK